MHELNTHTKEMKEKLAKIVQMAYNGLQVLIRSFFFYFSSKIFCLRVYLLLLISIIMALGIFRWCLAILLFSIDCDCCGGNIFFVRLSFVSDRMSRILSKKFFSHLSKKQEMEQPGWYKKKEKFSCYMKRYPPFI